MDAAPSTPPPPPVDHAAAPVPQVGGRLVDTLDAVLAHADGKAVTLRALTDLLAERGLAMVLIIATAPFLLPVPTMGLSAPAGFAVVLYGGCIMFGVKPWLPGFLARREIAYPTLEKVVAFARRWALKAQRVLRPRLKFMTWPGINVLLGLSLIFSGIFLSLPLPIPFTNAVPALAILLLLVGVLERDGVFVLAGQLLTLALIVLSGVILYLMYKYGVRGALRMLGFDKDDPAAPTTTTTAPAG